MFFRVTRIFALLAFLSTVAIAQTNPRLAWFNARDRLVMVEADRPVSVSLHEPDGKWLMTLWEGRLTTGTVLSVGSELPPGIYLLRIRSGGVQRLERITLM
jgi:hypothetical protein